jgi:hypothetical protein
VFERISHSFALAKSSWQVLKTDKQLVLFPLVSMIGVVLVVLSFCIPIGVLAAQGNIQMDANGRPPVWVYPVAFAFYFCNYFVIVFCNSALISCALMRFNGGEPTLGDGFRAAAARLPQILAWSLVSATVGMILKMIENANERVGEFISAILGTAWTIMTFFVVPVLVVEKLGPIDAIKRSISLLKKAWGEALIGGIGLGLFKLLLALPGILLVFVGGALLSSSVALGVGVIGAGILYLLGVALVGAALDAIYLGALYQYAAYDRVPNGFEQENLEGAFRRKGAR